MGKKQKPSKKPSKKIIINVTKELNDAFQLHQEGALDQALEMYLKIIDINPINSDGLYLAGLVHHQKGDNLSASELISKAILIKSDKPEFHNGLGHVYQQLNEHEKAVGSFQKTIELKPDFKDIFCSLGISYQALGDLENAFTSYQKALSFNSRDVNSNNNLGLIFQAKGMLNEAEEFYKKVIDVNPEFPQALNNWGLILQNKGNISDAISLYRRAVASNNLFFEAILNLGNALMVQGQLEESLELFMRVVHGNPGLYQAYNSIGNVLKKKGDMNGAIENYKKALDINQDFPETLYNLGTVYLATDQTEEALLYFGKCLEVCPHHAESYNNMGNIYKTQLRLDEAVLCYQKSIEYKPDYAMPYNNLGNIYFDQGKLDDALMSYEKTITLKPDLAEAYNNVGNILKRKGLFEDALNFYRLAIDKKSNYTDALYNIANLFYEEKEYEKSEKYYKQCIEIDPCYGGALSALTDLYQYICDWGNLKIYGDKLSVLTSNELKNGIKTSELPFMVLSRSVDISRIKNITKSWSDELEKRVSGIIPSFEVKKNDISKKKIVVGYLSNNYRNHPNAHLVANLFSLHNRDRFNVNCYSYGIDDGSNYREKIKQDCDQFIDIRGNSYVDAARRIHKDGVDILIDLTGYTRDSAMEICALRPAPIQVRYLGFPASMCASFFDYFITDKTMTPKDQQVHYTEKFVYMPNCYQMNSFHQDIPNTVYRRNDFGLPENSIVFCSFSSSYKIEPVMFGVWMKILKHVPDGVLWLLKDNTYMESNLKKEARAVGVDPERIIFSEKVPKQDHLARLKLADLALDTRIVGGHITTSDALWAGVPVITLQGDHFISRAPSSILKNIGLTEMITFDLDEYEALAVRLATHPGELELICEKIKYNRLKEPIFDTARFVNNYEKGLLKMWEIYHHGGNPEMIEFSESD